MTKSQQIQIAKDFIASHKNDDPESWFLSFPNLRSGDQVKYLEIFANLEGGVYGEVQHYDDERYETYHNATTAEVEISGRESKTGNPVIFEWSISDE